MIEMLCFLFYNFSCKYMRYLPSPSTTTSFFIHITRISYRCHDFYFALFSLFHSFSHLHH